MVNVPSFVRHAGLACCLASAALWTSCASRPKPQPFTPTSRFEPAEKSAQPSLAYSITNFDFAWSLINRTHFDTNFGGVNWQAVREELRPKALAAANLSQARDVIEEMLGRLKESHMVLIPKRSAELMEAKAVAGPDPGQNPISNDPNCKSAEVKVEPDPDEGESALRRGGDLGMAFRLVETNMVVTNVEAEGPAAQAGVKTGWIIDGVNGESLGAVLKEMLGQQARHGDDFTAWAACMARLHGKPGTQVRVTFLDADSRPVSTQFTRRRMPGQWNQLGKLPPMITRCEHRQVAGPSGEKIGVIQFNLWMAPAIRPFNRAMDELRGCDGMIIDLRGNVGGIVGMLMGVSGHFLTNRVVLGTMKLRELEMNIVANPQLVNEHNQLVQPFAGPVAILTDIMSVSASEVFSGGMQAVKRARVFGQRTSGQASPAAFDQLPNGDVLMHATADFVTATKVRLEGRGVIPDVDVPLRRADLLAGHDATLEAAIQWIAGEKRASAPSPTTPAAPARAQSP